ncbi:MAG: hypothetical protein IGS03_14860 [Candidatus Sericytochromatia bacterium]|nr:hypothetical protein [Candidatus Sericytochromatia bacterium]
MLTPALRQALLAGQQAADLTAIWRQEQEQSWLQDGLARAARGETSLEELLRVAAS